MRWYLNRFLTTFRAAVDKKFPRRSKRSDGTIGDRRHAASVSEHNPDGDGSVDAWDVDVNLLGSSDETGTAAEQARMWELIEEFEKQPQAQLWIFRGLIANRDVDNWRRRLYRGVNRHNKHAHLQSRDSREDTPYGGDLVVDAINAPEPRVSPGGKAPAWPFGPGDYYRRLARPEYRAGVRAAQAQLKKRGWKITVDGLFGPEMERVITAFQREKGLTADGKLGPRTWRALWESPVTR